MNRFAIAALVALTASTASAQEAVTYDVNGTFDDAIFGLESAITGRGLVVDWVSHTGEMLARTGEDVGSDVTLFDKADVYNFCSAALSRKMMEIDPLNIAHCPYAVFVFEREGEVTVGYRTQPEGEMQEVQALLDEIAREAAGE